MKNLYVILILLGLAPRAWAQFELPVIEEPPVVLGQLRSVTGDFTSADCPPFYDRGVVLNLREYWYIDDWRMGLSLPYGETYDGTGFQPLKYANGRELEQGRLIKSTRVDYGDSEFSISWRDPLSLGNPWLEDVYHISPSTRTRQNRYGYQKRRVYRVLQLSAVALSSGYVTASIDPWLVFYKGQNSINLGDLELNCFTIGG